MTLTQQTPDLKTRNRQHLAKALRAGLAIYEDGEDDAGRRRWLVESKSGEVDNHLVRCNAIGAWHCDCHWSHAHIFDPAAQSHPACAHILIAFWRADVPAAEA